MQKRFPLIAGCFLLGIALWLQLTPFPPIMHVISRLEDIFYDLQLQTTRFPSRHTRRESPVVIVDVNDASLAREGRWPWPREKLAILTQQLKKGNAAVIAFDMIFPEKESNPAITVLEALQKTVSDPPLIAALQKLAPSMDNDAKFAYSLGSLDTVLGLSFLTRPETIGMLPPASLLLSPQNRLQGILSLPGYLASLPLLQSRAKSGGFINMFPDEDGIVRRTPLFLAYHDRLYPSLALEAVSTWLLTKPDIRTGYYLNGFRVEGVNLGDHLIPVNEKTEVLIPFQGGSHYFPYYSAADVLHGLFSPNVFSGKIVFVGSTATSLGDLRATSIQSVFPGVEIHATVAAGILGNWFSAKPAWGQGAEVCMTVVLGLCLIVLFPLMGPRALALVTVLVPVLLVFLNSTLWERTGLLFSVLIPSLLAILLGILNILHGYFFETRHRERLRTIFGQYVPEKHISEMLAHEGSYSLYSEDRMMTVLFADIRNFTTLAEGHSADSIKNILNAFFTPMTEIIFRYNGTIDKYIGDMIMAFWGAPLNDTFHARHAIISALEMQKMVQKLQPEFVRHNWHDVAMGIGVNTGIMSVGDMGSRFRRNYTVLGDSVNLASRVESLTRFYGAKILVTSHTRAGEEDFVFRHVDRVMVKGKKNSIDIYEPLCLVGEETSRLIEELDTWHAALDLYFRQKWKQAYAQFEALCQKYPDSGLYPVYLKRTAACLDTPPSADWDGVYVHAAK